MLRELFWTNLLVWLKTCAGNNFLLFRLKSAFIIFIVFGKLTSLAVPASIQYICPQFIRPKQRQPSSFHDLEDTLTVKQNIWVCLDRLKDSDVSHGVLFCLCCYCSWTLEAVSGNSHIQLVLNYRFRSILSLSVQISRTFRLVWVWWPPPREPLGNKVNGLWGWFCSRRQWHCDRWE